MNCACREENNKIVEPCDFHRKWADGLANLQIDEKRRALKQCEDENSEFMKKTVRFKAALEDEQSSRASLIDALNTELRDSMPQSEQADVGSDLRYYLRLLVDQVRAQERKQTEKRNDLKDMSAADVIAAAHEQAGLAPSHYYCVHCATMAPHGGKCPRCGN